MQLPQAPSATVDAADRGVVSTRRHAAGVGSFERLRERKKFETLRGIQAAARKLVAERGLRQVTVEDIAAAANVSCRTFFNYYDSKEAAVFDTTEPNAVVSFAAALEARPAEETALQALHAAIRLEIVQHATGLRELGELVRQYPELAARENTAFAAFWDVIVAWAAKRLGVDPAESVHPMLLAGIAQTVTRIVLTHARPGDSHERSVELVDRAFDCLVGGLSRPPATSRVAGASPAGKRCQARASCCCR